MPVLTKINTNVIADNAVTAAKIPAGAVDSDIGVGSVTASHIAANAVGSSEIADDAVLPANISHLGDGAGNLSGTLTGEQLRFGTTFTLDDNLTVNGDVTLAKVGDDSTGQTLTHTASTARTITGTGTLRMGSSLSSVDGMTGALGSVVTGGSGLTALGTVTAGNISNSAIVYPAGHILQVIQTIDDNDFSFTNTTANDYGSSTTRGNDSFGGVASNLNVTITTKKANSSFLCRANMMHFCCSAKNYNVFFRTYWSVDSYATPVRIGSQSRGFHASGQEVQAGFWQSDIGDSTAPAMTSELLTTSSVAGGVAITFKIVIGCSYTSTGNILYYNRTYQSNNATYHLNPISTHTIYEIAT